jgi:hypothetical protein
MNYKLLDTIFENHALNSLDFFGLKFYPSAKSKEPPNQNGLNDGELFLGPRLARFHTSHGALHNHTEVTFTGEFSDRDNTGCGAKSIRA